MISKQASTLPRRLLRRYGTSVPFELADCLGITILECHDFKLQKGAFKVILNNCLRRWTKGYTIKQPNMDCQPTEITALMRHRAVFS